MNPQLEYLIQIQELDLRIRVLDNEIDAMPKEIELLRQNYLKEEALWEAAKLRLDELEKERRKKERELEVSEEKLSKYNTQLLAVKTNKEYTVMLHEIDQCKEGISDLEEDILCLFDQLEETQASLKEEKQKVEQKQKLFEAEKARIEARLSNVKKDRDDLIHQRDEIERVLEEDLSKEYHKLSEARKGLAVARAKDGSCVGCHIMLMPQLFQEIIKEEEKIFRCPNCHRFLFYKKDNEGQNE